MRTVDQVSLRGNWKTYYDSFSKKMIEDEDVDARSRIFNQLLRKEMVAHQKKGERLTMEEVYQICSVLTRRVYDLGVVDLSDFNTVAIRSSLQGATFATALACVDHAGRSYDFMHVHCFGHIPLSGLTQNEISFFLDCFSGDIDESWNMLIFKVLDIKMNSFERYRANEEKIVSMCRNATYQKVNSEVFSRYAIDLGLETKRWDRFKDYFTLRLI
jgi:hypothetical protein